jgi:hypothetical protein
VSDPELVIVDEAHHFRNPRTKRYAALAAICDRSRVLLLSATPLQNRREDLVAELALFLGDAAAAASDEELARFVVRRRAADAGLRLPSLIGPARVELPVEEDLLDELLALPAPVRGRDEGEAAALVSYTLLRQWSSSRAALVAGLRRRLAKALALTASLEAGRWPSREELIAWSFGDDALQLALPELLSPLGTERPAEVPFVSTRMAFASCSPECGPPETPTNAAWRRSTPSAARIQRRGSSPSVSTPRPCRRLRVYS